MPWPDCAPCHSLPDGGGGNRPPSGQPNVPANSRQSGLRVPLAASSPRYLALTNIRRRSQSLPAATEDQTPAPLYPKSCPDHRPPLPLSPVPLLHSHPFGGFGLKHAWFFPVGVLASLSIATAIYGPLSSDSDPIAFVVMLTFIYGGAASLAFCVGWIARQYLRRLRGHRLPVSHLAIDY